MTTPADREFLILRRGYVRDRVILAAFRSGLRNQVNPKTGEFFTDDEIQRATQPGSRFYNEAEAIDQLGQLQQRRALYLADQPRFERANSEFLKNYHGRLWGEEKLPATGGSGVVEVQAVPGTEILGSTTIPDVSAYTATDPAGKKYQVFSTVTTPSGGTAEVTMVGIDTGDDTNLDAGTELTWTNRDPNMQPTAVVLTKFTGGTNLETDGEFASRMAGNRRHKQGAGNDPQFRAWARASTNAVEDAFIYPCALNSGSTIVAITQKRANVEGPLARIPSSSTLGAAIGYLVPPQSPTVPRVDFVLVVPVQSEKTDAVMSIYLPRGSSAGWDDLFPFPSYHATTPFVSSVTTQVDFVIRCDGDATLPGQPALTTLSGAEAPHLMLWDEGKSQFVELNVNSVEDQGGNLYRVQLAGIPGLTVAVGQIVCPDIGRRALVDEALQSYFDDLGPGQLFDLDADPRGGRAERFPKPNEIKHFRVGASLATTLAEFLGTSAEDARLESLSKTEPSYPSFPQDGPKMLVPGKIGVYAL